MIPRVFQQDNLLLLDALIYKGVSLGFNRLDHMRVVKDPHNEQRPQDAVDHVVNPRHGHKAGIHRPLSAPAKNVRAKKVL